MATNLHRIRLRSLLGLVILAVSTAAHTPSKGVITYVCVTKDNGIQVDVEGYQLDFSNNRVNDRPAEFEITDTSIKWTFLPKRTDNKLDIYGVDGASINRVTGKYLHSGFHPDDTKRLTVCQVRK